MAPTSKTAGSIRDFLDNANLSKLKVCPICDALLNNVTFSFDGSAWEVPLPICPCCGVDATKAG